MAKVVFYRHCRLVQKTATGERRQVSWLPDRYAVAGKVLRLKAAGVWDDGWVVADVGHTRRAEADLPDFHQLSKAHLRATGDAETA